MEDYILNSVETGRTAFDFTYGKHIFSESLSEFKSDTEITADTEVQTDYTLTYTKEGFPLEKTVFATLYKEYPVCEWTVWLKNISGENTDTVYVFTDIDTGDSIEAIGAEVMQIGLTRQYNLACRHTYPKLCLLTLQSL